MLPSSTLCRLASRATALFSLSPSSASSLSSSTQDFPTLVTCTRALVLLAKPPGSSTEEAHLVRCLVHCTDVALHSLQHLPSSIDVPPDTLLLLFGVLRSSVGFWAEEKAVELARELSERVDAVMLRVWRPSVLLATVHAVAKACPSQSDLPFLADALALLLHHEAQLTERDVATLLWCLAVLRLAPTQQRLWASLCRRAALQVPRMQSVSRLTLSQALVLQQECLCESQAELLRVLHTFNREVESSSGADGSRRYASSRAVRAGRRLETRDGGQGGRGGAQLHAEGLRSHPHTAAPSQLSAQLLQHTTHALSDEALVRLLVTLLPSSTEATDELRLVLAHVAQRHALSERLCLQVLGVVQQWEGMHGGGAGELVAGPESARTPSSTATLASSSSPLESVFGLARQVRRHTTQQLVRQATELDILSFPREILEALCVEHHLAVRDPGSRGSIEKRRDSSGTSAGFGSEEMIWRAARTVLVKAGGQATGMLHRLSGPELWSWVCIRAYVQCVEGSPKPLDAASTASDRLHEAAPLHLHTDIQRYWPNSRERQEQCSEVVVAAAASRATQLLSYAGEEHSVQARQLLGACVQELQTCIAALPTSATLRLLAAVEEASPAIASVVQLLQPSLLSKLEANTAYTASALPDMLHYLSAALAHHRHSGSAATAAAGMAHDHVRVSDAVLDVYVRLLVTEQVPALPTTQVDLLVRCLQERQRRPASLENAFMMLLTRRLGQTASLMSATTLPVKAVCCLIELAGSLPRPREDAVATATRTLILASLLDALVQRCLPACNSADDLVAVALLLRLDLIGELQRVAEVATALEKRGVALLTGSGGPTWTSTQKAYLVAALVCAEKEPSPELLHALHGESAPLPTSAV